MSREAYRPTQPGEARWWSWAHRDLLGIPFWRPFAVLGFLALLASFTLISCNDSSVQDDGGLLPERGVRDLRAWLRNYRTHTGWAIELRTIPDNRMGEVPSIADERVLGAAPSSVVIVLAHTTDKADAAVRLGAEAKEHFTPTQVTKIQNELIAWSVGNAVETGITRAVEAIIRQLPDATRQQARAAHGGWRFVSDWGFPLFGLCLLGGLGIWYWNHRRQQNAWARPPGR